MEFLLAQLLSASVVLVGDVQPGSLPLEVIYGSMPVERCDGPPIIERLPPRQWCVLTGRGVASGDLSLEVSSAC